MVGEENVAVKALIDADRAQKNDDEFKEQLAQLSQELDDICTESAALRSQISQPRRATDSSNLSTTSKHIEKILRDFMALQAATNTETSKAS